MEDVTENGGGTARSKGTQSQKRWVGHSQQRFQSRIGFPLLAIVRGWMQQFAIERNSCNSTVGLRRVSGDSPFFRHAIVWGWDAIVCGVTQ